METRRYTALTASRQPVERAPPAPLYVRPGGRLWRILSFIADGPKPTPAVYLAARKRKDTWANRENPQTKRCLGLMDEAGWIVRADDTVQITPDGLEAVQGEIMNDAGRSPRGHSNAPVTQSGGA